MKKVNLIGPLCFTGYGVHTLNTAIELKKHVNLRIGPTGDYIPGLLPNYMNSCLELGLHNSEDTFNIIIWHLGTCHKFKQKGINIFFPVFENDSFINRNNEKNKLFIEDLKQADVIFTPTKWSKSVLEEAILYHNLNIPVYVVNEGISSLYNYEELNIEKADNVFISIGKFETRKGHYDILNALKRIKLKNPIMINALWHNPFISKFTILKTIEAFGFNILQSHNKQIPHYFATYEDVLLKLYLDYIPEYEKLKLIKNSTFGLFPSYAEGWNLGLTEVMACGKPCIVNNYSAHTQYCTENNSILLEEGDMENAVDGVFFTGDEMYWNKVNISELKEKIEWCLDDKNNKQIEQINRNLKDFKEKYSWNSSVQTIMQILNSLPTTKN